MIHQPDMIIGEGIPGAVDFQRSRRLSCNGVAQIRGDTAVLALKFLDRIERVAALQAGNRGIQSPARDDEQRKTRTGFFVIDANGTFFIEGHGETSPWKTWRGSVPAKFR